MPTANVYLPPDLHAQVQDLDVNVSAICQEALRRAVETLTNHCCRCRQPLPEKKEA
jgi:post-segregation antitoxin (ccd killing protein)